MPPPKTDQITAIYREACLVPTPDKATIYRSDQFIHIHTEWWQRDLDRNEKVRSTRSVLVNSRQLEEVLAVTPPVEIKGELFSEFYDNGTKKVILRKVSNPKSPTEDKYLIEYWKNGSKAKQFDLTALDKHGKPYEDDGEFGSFSVLGDKVLYIAEKKVPKSKSFFDKSDTSTAAGDCEKQESKKTEPDGEECRYRQDWGEQLAGKISPVICYTDSSSEDIVVLDGLDRSFSFGQAVWVPSGEGIIAVGWSNEPFKLGKKFCTNRRSALFFVDTAKCQKDCLMELTTGDTSVCCPRFSPDGKSIVFLQNKIGGPHNKGFQVCKLDWISRQIQVIVNPLDSVPEKSSDFLGVYNYGSLPGRIWTNACDGIIIDTQYKSIQTVVIVDCVGKTVEIISSCLKGCWSVLDVQNDVIIASHSTINKKPSLYIGRLPFKNAAVEWHPLFADEGKQISEISWFIKTLSPTLTNPYFPNLTYDFILAKPSGAGAKKIGLVICPHGGPHSAYNSGYSHIVALFVRLGFGVALVNYRGSTGYGEDSINSLPGNIRTQDVADVHQAAEYIIDNYAEFDPAKVVLYGGSHGGFLAAQLSGQYPDFYSAVSLRNPVIDVGSMTATTDIADWNYVEAGLPYDQMNNLNPEAFQAMWNKSVTPYIPYIKAPTLLQLGRNDLRVPCSQGLTYYNSLKAKGVHARAYVYDDNHSLFKVGVEADCFVHTVKWFFGAFEARKSQ